MPPPCRRRPLGPASLRPDLSVCRYRVLAVDHDLFSFADLKFEQWPVVLVTNPKDAQYMHPLAEPLGRIRRSTHIRFLLFVPNASASLVLSGASQTP